MTGGDRREHDVAILRRNRWRLLAMAWPLLFTLLGVLMLLMGDTSFVSLMVMGLVLAPITLRKAYEDNVDPQTVPTRLVIDGRTLVLDGESYDIDAIRSGYLLAADPPRIRLFLAETRLPIDVAFSSPDEASATLAELALSPRQRIATFDSFDPWKRGARGVVGALALMAPFTVAFVLFDEYTTLWLSLMLLVAIGAKSWRRKVHVGSDGLRVERGPLFDRFIAHEAITSAEVVPAAEQNQVQVHLSVAAERDVVVGFRSRQPAEAFVARLHQAARAAGRDDSPVASALSRGDAALTEWVAKLRSATRVGAHRTAALARDHLWTLVESSSIDPLRRAAAAVALGDRLDEPTKKRIAHVAAATASPRLRVVLDRVHEGADDDALVEALAALEQERPATRSSARSRYGPTTAEPDIS